MYSYDTHIQYSYTSDHILTQPYSYLSHTHYHRWPYTLLILLLVLHSQTCSYDAHIQYSYPILIVIWSYPYSYSFILIPESYSSPQVTIYLNSDSYLSYTLKHTHLILIQYSYLLSPKHANSCSHWHVPFLKYPLPFAYKLLTLFIFFINWCIG